MDRLDFTKSIDSNNFENMIVNFFDETMALYNLIGTRNNIDNITSKNDEKNIEFILLIEDEKEANTLYNAISSHDIEIYGKKYIAQLRNIKSNIHIALVDKSSNSETVN